MFAFLISWVAYLILVWPVGTDSGSTPAFTTCPDLVEEGSDLVCDCKAPPDVAGTSPSPVLTWEGRSVTPQAQLTVNGVRREQNGTQYRCQMTVGTVTTTSVYTLQVAYGPDNGSVVITAATATPFATNGTGTLTLSCLASGINPAPSYDWPGVDCISIGDSGGNRGGSTCSFRPQTDRDDRRKVLCRATNPHIFAQGDPIKSEYSIFSVELLYPPPTAPVVTSLDSDTFLRNGDVIDCTVSGGKPGVSAVNFYCTNPPLPDQGDVIGGSSVMSSLTVDTSTATSSTMSCFCSASWKPDEELYTVTTVSSLPMEYKASIVNFTLNQDLTSVTVKESDVVRQVNLSCSANGLPRPNITLSKMGADTGGGIIKIVPEVTSAKVTFSGLACERTGVYVCTVSNGLSRKPDQRFVRLNVLCGPKADALSNSLQTAPVLSKERGLVFSITANPTPDNFTYSIFDVSSGRSAGYTKLATGLRLNGRFSTKCTALVDRTYTATCVVSPLVVTMDDVGLYAVTLSNLLGSYDYYFRVNAETARALSALDGDDSLNVAAVAGGAAGGVALIVLIVAVVVCLTMAHRRGRKRTDAQNDTFRPQSRSRRVEDDDEFEEQINEAYVSCEALGLPGTRGGKIRPADNQPARAGDAIEYEDVGERDVSKPGLTAHPPATNPNYYPASGTDPSVPPVAAPSALKTSQKKRPSRVSFMLDDTTIGRSDSYDNDRDNDAVGTPRREAGGYRNSQDEPSVVFTTPSDGDYAVLGGDPAGDDTSARMSPAPTNFINSTYAVIGRGGENAPPSGDGIVRGRGGRRAEGDSNDGTADAGAKARRKRFFPGVESDYAVIDSVSGGDDVNNNSDVIRGGREDLNMSGDYAEIDRVSLPRQPNSPRSFADPLYASANSETGPETRSGYHGSTSSEMEDLSPGSIRGPLGDIYRQVSKRTPHKPDAVDPGSMASTAAAAAAIPDIPSTDPAVITVLPPSGFDAGGANVRPKSSTHSSSNGTLTGFGSVQTSPLRKDFVANGISGIHANDDYHHNDSNNNNNSSNNSRDSRPLPGAVRGRVASFEEMTRDGRDAEELDSRERKAAWDSNPPERDVYEDAVSITRPKAPIKYTAL